MKRDFNEHLYTKVIFSNDDIVTAVLTDESSSAIQDMNVDGSSSARIFSAVPPDGKFWVISRLMIYFSASTAFAEDKFANLTALTNGVSILCNNEEIFNWKDNMDIQTSMWDADGKVVYTKADRSISGRMSFFKMVMNDGLKVSDNVNGFGIKIQDNLSTLDQFRARIEGTEFNKRWRGGN